MSEAQMQITDGRKAKGLWREEACQMKRDGSPIGDIAAKFGKAYFTVAIATKGVKSTNPTWGRTFRGKSGGHVMGNKKRVAISFTDEQIGAVNIIAEEKGCSFSKAVADLVDIALEEIIA